MQTKESSASQQQTCPEITQSHMRNTSLWSEFVRNADFINVDEAEAIQELVSQTSELKAIFNHFKELYVSYISTSTFQLHISTSAWSVQNLVDIETC